MSEEIKKTESEQANLTTGEQQQVETKEPEKELTSEQANLTTGEQQQVETKELEKELTSEQANLTTGEQQQVETKELEKELTNEEKLENFDWKRYEEGTDVSEDYNSEEFDKLVDENFVETHDESVVEGQVVRITDLDVIIDINSKSEGIISLNEFRYNNDLKVGDKVDVLIDQKEDTIGQLILSHRKARMIKAWERINKAHETGEIMNGHIKCKTRGGMIVEMLGIEAFLPGSQIDMKPIRDYDQYVGSTMEFKVVKINQEFKNIVVSHKALIEADIAEQKKEIIGQLEKGQVIEGFVKNLTNYGVFVDLGGVDGLIHITDISWKRIASPSEVLELDQKLKVVILDFDEDKTRIQLGLKQLEQHPWDRLDENLKAGDKIKGKVTVLADYGAFVEIAENVEGLVHVSEMSWSPHLRSAQDFVKVGDEIEVQVLSLDREDRKMSLGMKQLTPDPWADITSKYLIGAKHVGTVKNFTSFGVFVELEEGIDGLIYISDLSWTKRVKHPSDYVNVNDKIDVMVLEIDVDNRKISLGHKQTKENPWDKYEEEYAVDTIHEGKVIKILDKGAIITFGEDVEVFVPTRFLEKEDGSKLKVGDVDKFKVIEFNKEFKKILASHTSVFKEKESRRVKKAIQNTNVEKTTLGDIQDLANLKTKMDKENKK